MIGSVLIAAGELGFFLFISSPLSASGQNQTPLGVLTSLLWVFLVTASLWLLITSSDKFRIPLFPSLARLIQNTDNPHRTSLWVHWVFTTLAFINSMVLIIGFFIVLGTKTWSPSWGFLAGISAILLVYYNRLVLSGLGQRSEDNSGSSFVLAAGLASLSARMFSRHKRDGLSPLLHVLKMTGVLFYRRRYRPILLPAVETTVEGLVDLEAAQLPFSELEALAQSLTLLPRREGLQPALEKFLTEMKWPGGFEKVEAKGMSGYELLTIVVFAATAVGSLLVIIPRPVQEGFYDQVVSFVSLQGWSVLGGGMLFAGVLYSLVATKYEAYFRLLIRGFMSGHSAEPLDSPS